jgi:hypothetical protein
MCFPLLHILGHLQFTFSRRGQSSGFTLPQQHPYCVFFQFRIVIVIRQYFSNFRCVAITVLIEVQWTARQIVKKNDEVKHFRISKTILKQRHFKLIN